MRRLLLVVLAAMVLTACAHRVVETAPLADPVPAAGKGGAIRVASTYHPGLHGELYIEGALVEVRLRDHDGTIVATKIASPGRPIWFRHLREGRYQVSAALRPCDGNCGYLDPRVDGCRSYVVVGSGVVKVKAGFQVGSPCSLE